MVHSHSGWLGHKLCYAAPALPALRQLSLEADAVALCPSYARALPALTHLSLTGMAVQLPAGCLPRTLRMLRVSLQGEHAALSRGLVAQLPAAAEGSPGIQCFELAWNTRRVVPLAGLSALRALTALRLRSVRIEALPEDLVRLLRAAGAVPARDSTAGRRAGAPGGAAKLNWTGAAGRVGRGRLCGRLDPPAAPGGEGCFLPFLFSWPLRGSGGSGGGISPVSRHKRSVESGVVGTGATAAASLVHPP